MESWHQTYHPPPAFSVSGLSVLITHLAQVELSHSAQTWRLTHCDTSKSCLDGYTIQTCFTPAINQELIVCQGCGKACNPRIQRDVEKRGPGDQGHPRLHRESEVRPCLKQTQSKETFHCKQSVMCSFISSFQQCSAEGLAKSLFFTKQCFSLIYYRRVVKEQRRQRQAHGQCRPCGYCRPQHPVG